MKTKICLMDRERNYDHGFLLFLVASYAFTVMHCHFNYAVLYTIADSVILAIPWCVISIFLYFYKERTKRL